MCVCVCVYPGAESGSPGVRRIVDEAQVAHVRLSECVCVCVCVCVSLAGSLGSRRIVDEFESHLAEANSKCERNKQK